MQTQTEKCTDRLVKEETQVVSAQQFLRHRVRRNCTARRGEYNSEIEMTFV